MKRTLIFIVLILCFGVVFAAEPAVSPKRIVSLSPATTEILFALGLGDRIIGVTSYCDHPEEAKSKPKIGGMSNPSLEAIVTLKPDLVVMTTDGNPREVEERLRSLKIRTYVFRARRLAQLPAGIRELGAAVGVAERGDLLAKRIEDAVRAESSRGRKHAHARKVLFIVWPEPLLVAGPGTAIDDAIVLLGMRNAASEARTAYPRYSIEEVIHQAPDVLFVGKASGMDMSVVTQGILRKLSSIPAVRNNAVCFIGDGLYRLGPRVVPGIRELAECAL
jgi:iron complex transport system substrate-binding protein